MTRLRNLSIALNDIAAVDHDRARDLQAGCRARDEEEAEPRALFRPAVDAGHHDDAVGHVAVEHEVLVAAQAEALAVALRPRRNAVGRVLRSFLDRGREQLLAGAYGGEHALVLLGRAGVPHEASGERGAGDERRGCERASALGEHDAELAPGYPVLTGVIKAGSRAAIWLSERF